jgi:hypothetical protein
MGGRVLFSDASLTEKYTELESTAMAMSRSARYSHSFQTMEGQPENSRSLSLTTNLETTADNNSSYPSSSSSSSSISSLTSLPIGEVVGHNVAVMKSAIDEQQRTTQTTTTIAHTTLVLAQQEQQQTFQEITIAEAKLIVGQTEPPMQQFSAADIDSINCSRVEDMMEEQPRNGTSSKTSLEVATHNSSSSSSSSEPAESNAVLLQNTLTTDSSEPITAYYNTSDCVHQQQEQQQYTAGACCSVVGKDEQLQQLVPPLPSSQATIDVDVENKQQQQRVITRSAQRFLQSPVRVALATNTNTSVQQQQRLLIPVSTTTTTATTQHRQPKPALKSIPKYPKQVYNCTSKVGAMMTRTTTPHSSSSSSAADAPRRSVPKSTIAPPPVTAIQSSLSIAEHKSKNPPPPPPPPVPKSINRQSSTAQHHTKRARPPLDDVCPADSMPPAKRLRTNASETQCTGTRKAHPITSIPGPSSVIVGAREISVRTLRTYSCEALHEILMKNHVPFTPKDDKLALVRLVTEHISKQQSNSGDH